MNFVSGLFSLDLDVIDPGSTVAWAECGIDLMGQPIVQLHYVAADGFGKDTYGWYDNLFLRVDCVAGRLDLVFDIEGEWSIEASFETADIHDYLVEAKFDDADPEELLGVLLAAAASKLQARPLTEDDVSRLGLLPLMTERAIKAEVSERGRWDPPDFDSEE